jgi:hypothetical protein
LAWGRWYDIFEDLSLQVGYPHVHLPTFTDVSKGCSLFTFKLELLDSEAENTTLPRNFGNNMPIITALITSQNTSIFSNTTERYTQNSVPNCFTSFTLFRL